MSTSPATECPHDRTDDLPSGWSLCLGCGISIAPRALPVRVTVRAPVSWCLALEDLIVASVLAGARPTTAARPYGVSPDLLRRWLRSEESHLVNFRERIEDAHATARMEVEIALRETEKRFWISKVDPEWADSARKLELSGHTTSAQVVVTASMRDLRELSTAELQALLVAPDDVE